MSNNAKVLLDIDNSMIQQAVVASVAAAITEKVGGAEEMARQMVSHILNAKVDSEGKVNSYSSYNTHSWLEATARNHIKKIAEAALIEYLNENAAAMKAAMIREFKKSPDKFANALFNSIENGLVGRYSHNLTISFEEKR